MWYLIFLFIVGICLIPLMAFAFPVIVVGFALTWLGAVRKDNVDPRFKRTEVFVILLATITALRLWWG